VFAREGVLALIDTTRLPLPARMRCVPAGWSSAGEQGGANRLAAALTRLGPTYVKLGRFLATRQPSRRAARARS